jgi:hypothetical protein
MVSLLVELDRREPLLAISLVYLILMVLTFWQAMAAKALTFTSS